MTTDTKEQEKIFLELKEIRGLFLRGRGNLCDSNRHEWNNANFRFKKILESNTKEFNKNSITLLEELVINPNIELKHRKFILDAKIISPEKLKEILEISCENLLLKPALEHLQELQESQECKVSFLVDFFENISDKKFAELLLISEDDEQRKSFTGLRNFRILTLELEKQCKPILNNRLNCEIVLGGFSKTS